MVGKIYLAKIYFTNGENYKLRPILIIKENSFKDYIYIPFTTEANNTYSLKFSNSDLKTGKFQKISYLIIDKTCTIQSTLLTKEIGQITDEKLQEVFNLYCDFLNT